MNKKIGWKLAAVMLGVATAFSTLPQSVLLAQGESAQQQAAASITILPIDRATILAGQQFDFRVELNNGTANKDDLKVTINGEDAEKFFGKQAERTNANATSAEYTIRNVSIDKPGDFAVAAEVKVDGKTVSKTVRYEVYQTFGDAKNAKNVILMIGDGMSANIRTAARVVSKGIDEGKFKGWLEMEKMDRMGMVTTSGMDSIVTDSANSASAYATGNKTAVSAEGVYPDNTADPLDDPRIENIVELVKRTKGMSTGIVTTADITDATPAAMAAHTRKRSTSEAIVNMYYELGSRPDVLMGGGKSWFLPADQGGKRKDDKNMIDQFKAEGYAYASNAAELNSLGNPDKILGLFKSGTMNVYFDREYRPNNEVLGIETDQPNLMEMTAKAIDALDNNKNGFFLMVEGASIDKQAHPMDFERLIWDTIEFDKTVGLAKQYAAEHKDTLVIVTSDHGHSMTLNGSYNTAAAEGKTGEELRELVGTYADSKFPTYVDANGDGFPDNPDSEWKLAVGWGNHPDYNEDYLTNPKPISPTVQDPNVKDKRWYIANPDKDPNGVRFNGNLPHDEAVEVHTFDDVPINTMGPGSELFTGYMDNTQVFRNMVTALGIQAVQKNKHEKGQIEVSEKHVTITDATGQTKQLSAAPIIKNDRSFVQVRELVESLGGTLEWKESAQQVVIHKGETTIILTVGSNMATVNGTQVAFDAPAFMENDRVFVPVRFLAESLGFNVGFVTE